jgi:hypothetical protein
VDRKDWAGLVLALSWVLLLGAFVFLFASAAGATDHDATPTPGPSGPDPNTEHLQAIRNDLSALRGEIGARYDLELTAVSVRAEATATATAQWVETENNRWLESSSGMAASIVLWQGLAVIGFVVVLFLVAGLAVSWLR